MIEAVKTTFADLPAGPIGVAVSGGGDSMALLLLAVETGRQVFAATVDHGLRVESAKEAALVGEFCQMRGIPHEILRWQESPSGNLQAAARDARLDLLSGWSNRHGLRAVALGHTLDDQAETVLMRLARGSGVDGLAGMAATRSAQGTLWIRPLLWVKRAHLREYLRAQSVTWVDDPSNEDTGFDRVKARKALAALSDLGITAEGLADTAMRQARARRALETATHELALTAATLDDAGCIRISVSDLVQAPQELRLRLLSHSLCWASAQKYRPRADALGRLGELLGTSFRTTLHGAVTTGDATHLFIAREFARVQEAVPVGEIWDGRWHVTGPMGGHIAALGEDGLSRCPDTTKNKAHRDALLASPAVWKEGSVVAAPCAGLENGYKARHVSAAAGYFAAIVTG